MNELTRDEAYSIAEHNEAIRSDSVPLYTGRNCEQC